MPSVRWGRVGAKPVRAHPTSRWEALACKGTPAFLQLSGLKRVSPGAEHGRQKVRQGSSQAGPEEAENAIQDPAPQVGWPPGGRPFTSERMFAKQAEARMAKLA